MVYYEQQRKQMASLKDLQSTTTADSIMTPFRRAENIPIILDLILSWHRAWPCLFLGLHARIAKEWVVLTFSCTDTPSEPNVVTLLSAPAAQRSRTVAILIALTRMLPQILPKMCCVQSSCYLLKNRVSLPWIPQGQVWEALSTHLTKILPCWWCVSPPG